MQIVEIAAGIWENAPVWVWPLLLLLLALGLLSTRTRRSPIALMVLLPLLGLLSVNAILGLPQASFALLPAFGGYALGTVWAFRRQKRWILGFERGFVRLRGEWLTLITLMLVFWSNFTAGVAEAIGGDIYQSPLFSVLFALIIASVSGTFLGRTARVVWAWRGERG